LRQQLVQLGKSRGLRFALVTLAIAPDSELRAVSLDEKLPAQPLIGAAVGRVQKGQERCAADGEAADADRTIGQQRHLFRHAQFSKITPIGGGRDGRIAAHPSLGLAVVLIAGRSLATIIIAAKEPVDRWIKTACGAAVVALFLQDRLSGNTGDESERPLTIQALGGHGASDLPRNVAIVIREGVRNTGQVPDPGLAVLDIGRHGCPGYNDLRGRCGERRPPLDDLHLDVGGIAHARSPEAHLGRRGRGRIARNDLSGSVHVDNHIVGQGGGQDRGLRDHRAGDGAHLAAHQFTHRAARDRAGIVAVPVRRVQAHDILRVGSRKKTLHLHRRQAALIIDHHALDRLSPVGVRIGGLRDQVRRADAKGFVRYPRKVDRGHPLGTRIHDPRPGVVHAPKFDHPAAALHHQAVHSAVDETSLPNERRDTGLTKKSFRVRRYPLGNRDPVIVLARHRKRKGICPLVPGIEIARRPRDIEMARVREQRVGGRANAQNRPGDVVCVARRFCRHKDAPVTTRPERHVGSIDPRRPAGLKRRRRRLPLQRKCGRCPRPYPKSCHRRRSSRWYRRSNHRSSRPVQTQTYRHYFPSGFFAAYE